MKTAIVSALIMSGLAAAISMAVALLIKVLFVTIRSITRSKKG